jgi:exodeoxyribonuclease-3
MRITTWNVNGIRAVLRKEGWDWVKEYDPDVVCVQEVRAHSHQLSEDQLKIFTPYDIVWNAAERGGYSGTLTLTRLKGLVSELGMGEEIFDKEGRVIRTRFEDFYLYNIYFPNGGRDLERVPFKLDFYAHLLEDCNQLHSNGENIIITGDFNTAHREIDLANPKENEGNTGFLPEERAWVDTYLESGFQDAYRKLYPDKVEYTWWTYRGNARARNVGWRLDYFLVSEALMPRVKDVIVHGDVLGSDHCPVTMVID